MKTLHLIAAAAMLLAARAAGAADLVETLDARQFSGEVLGISAEQVVIKTDKGKQTLARTEVSEISFGEAPELLDRRGQGVIITHGGDRIAFANLRLADGKFSFVNPMMGQSQLEISAADLVYNPSLQFSPAQIEQRCKELRIVTTTQDTLVVAQKESWMGVEGVLKGMDPNTGKITFRWNDDDKTLASNIVMAVRMASSTAAPTARPAVLTGKCGTVVGVSAIALDEKNTVVTVIGMGEKKISRDLLAGIRFSAGNIVNLADLKPSEVKEKGFFQAATPFPYKVNRSVGGTELKLGGKTYRTGLGMHSQCQLTYKIDGEYVTFVATAGIDDAVRPNGKAVLSFLADQKPVGESLLLTGKTDPAAVRLDIKGVKQLTIRVDFAENATGSGDHVDLVSARLIK